MCDVCKINGQWFVRSLSVCFGAMVLTSLGNFAQKSQALKAARKEVCAEELTLKEFAEEIHKWKVRVSWEEKPC